MVGDWDDLALVIGLAEAYLFDAPQTFLDTLVGQKATESVRRVWEAFDNKTIPIRNYIIIRYVDGKALPFREDGTSEDDVPF